MAVGAAEDSRYSAASAAADTVVAAVEGTAVVVADSDPCVDFSTSTLKRFDKVPIDTALNPIDERYRKHKQGQQNNRALFLADLKAWFFRLAHC